MHTALAQCVIALKGIDHITDLCFLQQLKLPRKPPEYVIFGKIRSPQDIDDLRLS